MFYHTEPDRSTFVAAAGMGTVRGIVQGTLLHSRQGHTDSPKCTRATFKSWKSSLAKPRWKMKSHPSLNKLSSSFPCKMSREKFHPERFVWVGNPSTCAARGPSSQALSGCLHCPARVSIPMSLHTDRDLWSGFIQVAAGMRRAKYRILDLLRRKNRLKGMGFPTAWVPL